MLLIPSTAWLLSESKESITGWQAASATSSVPAFWGKSLLSAVGRGAHAVGRAETIRVTSSQLLLKASYIQSRQLDPHYPWLLVRFFKEKWESPKVLQPRTAFGNLMQLSIFIVFAMLFRYNPPNAARIDTVFKMFCLSLHTAGFTGVFAWSIT